MSAYRTEAEVMSGVVSTVTHCVVQKASQPIVSSGLSLGHVTSRAGAQTSVSHNCSLTTGKAKIETSLLLEICLSNNTIAHFQTHIIRGQDVFGSVHPQHSPGPEGQVLGQLCQRP